MRSLLLVIPVLALACDGAVGPDLSDLAVTRPDIGEPFELHVGERATIEGIDLGVRFLEVAADSRCPSNALILCVWAGDAAVVVETAPVGIYGHQHVLHTTLDPDSVILGTVRLTLRVLDPYPEDVTPISQGDYVATFVVEPVE